MPKNEKLSQSWLRKAADGGYADAEYNMGLLYERGKDLPKSEMLAKQWFKKAADQGDTEA